MNARRGDVVVVQFPYAAGAGSKRRPALVVQNDKDNARLLNTIVVQVTSTTRRAFEPTQVLIEIATADGQASGLAFDSVVNCANVVTLDKKRVLRKLGSLPDVLMRRVGDALKSAMDLQ